MSERDKKEKKKKRQRRRRRRRRSGIIVEKHPSPPLPRRITTKTQKTNATTHVFVASSVASVRSSLFLFGLNGRKTSEKSE